MNTPSAHREALTRRVVAVRAARIVGVPIVMLVVYSLIPLQGDRWVIGVVVGVGVIAATVPFTRRRVRAVSTSAHPGLEAVEALASLFSMLVLGFSVLYLTIDRDADQFIGLDTRIDALYFTVTTLSTVGFGDVTAAGQAARVAVTAQIVLDFTLLAVGVRWLTSTARRRMDIDV